MDGNSAEKPKMKGSLEDLAKMSADKSLEDIKNIGSNSDVSVEIGQTWKVKVPEAPEIDIAKFSTSTTVKENRQQFGAFSKSGVSDVPSGWSHYVKDDVKEQPAKVNKDAVSEKPEEKKDRQSKKTKPATASASKTKTEPTEEDLLADAWVDKVKETPTGEKADATKEVKKPLTKAEKEIEARTHSESMLGPEIPVEEPDTRTREEKILGTAWEKESLKNTPEQAWSEWLESKKHAESLERDFNAKYKTHVEGLQKGVKGWARRTFGIKLAMTPELESMHAAVLAANGDYKEKAKLMRELKDTKSVGYTEDRKEAVLARHERFLAYKMGVGLHKQRIKVQNQVLAERWDQSKIFKPCLDTIARHKGKSIAAMAVGAAVIGGTAVATGGTSVLAAGLIAGLGTRYGLNWAGKKTYVRSAEKNLQQAGNQLKDNFFEKSLTETDAEIEKWAHQIGLREARVKTGSRVVGAIAGFTAAGITSGRIDLGLGDFVGGNNGGVPTDMPKSAPFGSTPYEGGMVSGPPSGEGSIILNDIPDPKLEGVPSELRGGSSQFTDIPDPRVEGVPPDLEVKGGIKFTEIPDPRMEGVPPDLKAVPESPIVEHTVVKGENAWNIMEGRGPDANPVGGKSLYLKELNLPMGERQALLDEAVKYLEQDTDLAKEIGAVKSDGNIHKIYPGETINVTKFDELLRNLYEGNDPGAVIEAPTNEEFYEDLGTDEEPHEPVEEGGGGSTAEYKVADPKAVSFLEELNKLGEHHREMLDRATPAQRANLADIYSKQVELKIHNFAASLNPNYVEGMPQPATPADMERALTLLGEARGQFADVAFGDGNGQISPAEMETAGKTFAGNPALSLLEQKLGGSNLVASNDSVPVVTPDNVTTPEPVSSPEAVADATDQNYENGFQESLNDFVRSVEQPRGRGILDIFDFFGTRQPNIAGTFDQMKNISMGQLREMVANNELPENVSDEGFDQWWGRIAGVAANNNERFGDVVARVVANEIVA